MPRIVDKEAERLIMGEINELYEMRQKLENDIKAMDALSSHRIEMGALQDIEAYRTVHRLSTLPV